MKERTIQRYLSSDITKGAKPKLSASDILSLAKSSIGINNKSLETVLVSKIKQLFFMQSQLEEFNQLIEAFVDEHHNDDIDLLTSIPGVGKPTASSFLTKLGDINNFKTYKQLTVFIGTDPSVFQSGSSVNIFKRGNAHLRRAIWHIARISTVWNNTLKAYYNKKRNEGKTFKQSIIPNKLISIIFSMLKNTTKLEADFSSFNAQSTFP